MKTIALARHGTGRIAHAGVMHGYVVDHERISFFIEGDGRHFARIPVPAGEPVDEAKASLVLASWKAGHEAGRGDGRREHVLEFRRLIGIGP